MTGWWDSDDDDEFSDAIGNLPLASQEVEESESLDVRVRAYLATVRTKVPRSVHRAAGYHASQFYDPCTRFEVLKQAIPKSADGKRFPPALLLRFEIGHAVHEHFQRNVLGKMRILRGTWCCSRCTNKVHGVTMPTGPCEKCKWPTNKKTTRRAPRSRVSVPCASVCKWPGGFDAKERDCVHCFRGGSWKFKETFLENIEGTGVVGSYDGEVLYGAKWRIWEGKSKDVFAFEHLVEPDPRHVFQTNVYLWGKGWDEGVICYINKNSGRMKEFLVKFDPEVPVKIRASIKEIEDALESGELPMGPCASPNEKRAKECAFRKECFSRAKNVAEMKERFVK